MFQSPLSCTLKSSQKDSQSNKSFYVKKGKVCVRMIYLLEKQVWLIQSAGALLVGSISFTAGQRHCVVVAGVPGGVGPAGGVSDTAALHLQTQRYNRQD